MTSVLNETVKLLRRSFTATMICSNFGALAPFMATF